MEMILQSIRKVTQPSNADLESAASSLLSGYREDKELIAFTALLTEKISMKRSEVWLINLAPL